MHDVIVVGAGLVGSWAAKKLAEAGLRVLLLDAGPAVTCEEAHDSGAWTPERRAVAMKRQPIQSSHSSYWDHNPNLFVDDVDHPYVCEADPFVWIRGRQVGGRSLTWAGLTPRFSDAQFSGHWPIRYAELSVFYDEVERYLGIAGSCEQLAQLPDGVFVPPPALSEAELHFKAAVEARWSDRKVIHARCVLEKPLSSAHRHPHWMQRTTLSAMLPDALATQRVDLLPNAVVSHLLTGNDVHTVSGVACVDRLTRRPFEACARTVVLCASTLESVRILLNTRVSGDRRFLGNSSVLGHFLMDHAVVALSGFIPGSEGIQLHPAGGPHGILIPRFRNLTTKHQDFVLGYGIWGAMQRGGYHPTGCASWFLHALIEVLPRYENGSLLDSRQVDAWNIPVLRVHYSYSDNERNMGADAELAMREMIGAAGFEVDTCHLTLPGAYVHELGGARMGTDRGDSVLNPLNQCWEAQNLFVVDGACFVTSGWQNPSLTALALAGRACSAIVAEARRRTSRVAP